MQKGDEEKVKDLSSDLGKLKEKYTFDSEKHKKMYAGVGEMIGKMTAQLSKYINQ